MLNGLCVLLGALPLPIFIFNNIEIIKSAFNGFTAGWLCNIANTLCIDDSGVSSLVRPMTRIQTPD